MSASRRRREKDRATRRDKPKHSNKHFKTQIKGGYGSFNWGDGQIFDETDVVMDRGDPCYDSEDENDYILISRRDEEIASARRLGIATGRGGGSSSSARGAASYIAGSPPRFEYDPVKMMTSMTRGVDGKAIVKKPATDHRTFKRMSESILNEYFVSADVEEARRRLESIRCPVFHFEFVKRAVTMSMDRDNRTRESVSRLLSELYPTTVSTNQIGKGFERIFEQMEELTKDCPKAHKIVVKFLCRAAIDEILPPSFFTNAHVQALGGTVLEDAKSALSSAHKSSRLERIWGPGDGRDVSQLKIAIEEIVKEYLESGLVGEAAACVRELDAAHFHHEFVKRAMCIAMDRDEASRRRVSALFRHLFSEEIISRYQFEVGFRRTEERLPDIRIDVPGAPRMLAAFEERGAEGGYLGSSASRPRLPSAVSAAAKASAERS